MKKIDIFIIICGLFLFAACKNEKEANDGKNESFSEWRDNNEIDSISFYNSNDSCNKIIGKLNVKSRLHKNLMEKGIFGGGMSSRWLEIKKDSITYFAPNGEIADRGKCNCENGVLKVNWEVRYSRQIEYKIHFNSKDFVELRYYDYPFSFDTFEYDTTKDPTNPTKVIGTME
ncbi:hypothetical protein [Psychroserpens ponticola]|uniref:Lipoprotein n=1 Tax=Psychroserpens ponticola TaxID=2932268 RepID=A0ABY7RT11_9FLAO|nr:hypothetical protein [Psychroserpens ponticola]WCO00249.1 hypothetical protein MUN68_009195 [Psychroserpens ponticola]